ncbi:fumarylacetoacetate hydrolase family protein [Roseateles paludis]|uniref:Fumarylacetoacetate hydrolase family protein n=1 Tax=Roseateles paludis TaxID=3145238 RepID=A0ABV0G3B5_9BURK
MVEQLISALVTALTRCHREGTRLRATDWQHAVRSEADAYAVQEGVAAALGWPLTRWKSGGARREGPFSHSPVNPVASQHLLGIEVEVALRLGRDVSPAPAQEPLTDAIDAMCVSIELIASRWEEGLAAPELLRFADHQSNAGLLLGDWQPYRPLDWAALPWRLRLEGQPEIARQGGHALADPAWVVPHWLRHATRTGRTLPAGSVVTTGAWAGLHPLGSASAGELWMQELGTLSFSARA